MIGPIVTESVQNANRGELRKHAFLWYNYNVFTRPLILDVLRETSDRHAVVKMDGTTEGLYAATVHYAARAQVFLAASKEGK